MDKKIISITIKNNTNGVIPISLGLPVVNGDSIINADNTYSWDVCSQLFEELTNVSVDASFNGGPVTTYTAPVYTQSLQGVLNALNTLRIGTFYSTVVAGRTNIAVTNDFYVYDALAINDNSQSNAINFRWSFIFNSPLPAYDFNVLNEITSDTIFSSSNTASGSVTGATPVSKGDLVSFNFQPLTAGTYTGTAKLFKNGCLTDTLAFSGSGGSLNVSISTFYDRNPDIYTFTILVN